MSPYVLAPVFLVVANAAAAATGSKGANDPRLLPAFQTAFGRDARMVRTVDQTAQPFGSGISGGLNHQVRLVAKPAVLVDLGCGGYALVAREVDEDAPHADPGALAIAYLSLTRSGWAVRRVWPEAVWAGNSGEPADALSVVAARGAPMLVASNEYTGQGQTSDTGWLIRLAPEGPLFLGRFPIGGNLDQDVCAPCLKYHYAGHVEPPSEPGAVISVGYTGWAETAPGVRAPVRVTAEFVARRGRLSATRKLDLPDGSASDPS